MFASFKLNDSFSNKFSVAKRTRLDFLYQSLISIPLIFFHKHHLRFFLNLFDFLFFIGRWNTDQIWIFKRDVSLTSNIFRFAFILFARPEPFEFLLFFFFLLKVFKEFCYDLRILFNLINKDSLKNLLSYVPNLLESFLSTFCALVSLSEEETGHERVFRS